jgi:membrane-anchored protein YejM (alkaline phosphatase superfamily)
MNRRTFVLRWGRKLFFGISWPLSSLLTLLYFQSFILPENKMDFFYLLVTLVGHVGLLNFLFYSCLYVPVVFVLPTYYTSRIWSLLLIASLNLFILLDALSFSIYNNHIYGFISKLILQNGIHHLIGSNLALWVLGVASLFIAIFIWIRGESIWRYMQGRFSNPVSNWYLILIFLCLGVSKVSFRYLDIHPKLAEIFPFNINFARIERERQDNRKLYYPSDNLQCQGKQNPNIVLIVVKEWSVEELNQKLMPKTFHMKNHAISYNFNYGVSTNVEGSLYSLFYSIPATYKSSTGANKPAIYEQLGLRKYDVVDKSNDDYSLLLENLKSRRLNNTGVKLNPYFISIILQDKAAAADNVIQNIVLQLQNDDLLKNTHVLITGAFSGMKSSKVPLLWMTPEQTDEEVNFMTSQYDIMPTLMQKIWGCKKAFKNASIGRSFESDEKDWLLITGDNGFKIIDFKKDSVTTVFNGEIQDSGLTPRHELIFKALKSMTKFNKP